MKTPKRIEPLVEDGLVDEVLRPLMSGKEAAVYVVRCGNELRCAKVYKEADKRSFRQAAEYQEGRKVRGSRQARAMAKGTKYGRKEQEQNWQNAEVAALFRLANAGVRVPTPYDFLDGVLLMELVTDDEGYSAARLSEVVLDAEKAVWYHTELVRDVVRMLSLGLIHGDLSEYNVLVTGQGPVIIDFPQVVSAAGNNAAREMLLRDVHNIRDSLARSAPELSDTHYGEEMWALYEQGELSAGSELTGRFTFAEGDADVAAVMESIEDARQEAIIRQQGREAAEQDL